MRKCLIISLLAVLVSCSTVGKGLERTAIRSAKFLIRPAFIEQVTGIPAIVPMILFAVVPRGALF